MKNVAIIACCDTKFKEVGFLIEQFHKKNVNPILIDISIGLKDIIKADVTKNEVLKSIGKDWEDIKDLSKGELFTLMSEAIKVKILTLYKSHSFDGVISMGGVQNTYVATGAMRVLPLGVPKVISTTIACGKRTFDQVVGESDIVVIPSISDFTGLNMITEMSLKHAASCMVGMLNDNETELEKTDKIVVGVSLLGVTNGCAQSAINELNNYGIEAIGFHATGVGGHIMDTLSAQGIIDGILDLSLHEIASEFFHGGFSYGETKRLIEPLAKNVPLIITPSGLDFVDYLIDEVPFSLDDRKYVMHNSSLAHIKIKKEEAYGIGNLVGQRLSKSSKVIEMLVPSDGFRINAKKGEPLSDPDIDEILVKTILESSNGKVKANYISGNFNEKDWGIKAATRMAELLGVKHV